MSTLNVGQQHAADVFFQFLFSADKEMILSGAGGTGKTHTMGELIDVVLPKYFETCKLLGIEPKFDEVHMTATTNPAASVLSLATKRPTSTIHSFLGLKVTDDYSTGKSKLTKIPGRWMVHENQIIFLDEAFTADTPLYNLIQEGTHNCKIVYVGDHCQLAPVMELVSPITRLGIPMVKLTQSMRNAEQPALMDVCQQLRNTVETGEFHPITIVPGVIDWLDDEDMQREIADHFTHQTNEARILCYTNDQVIAYNEHIRDLRQLPVEFQQGELLVNANSLKINDRMLAVEEQIEIVRQSGHTEHVPITKENGREVTLEIRRSDIISLRGEYYHDVKIPVDRDHYLRLLKYYQQMKHWALYFKLKAEFPDFRARDAATLHKAQGSSYTTTFIDVGNLSTCHNAVTAARLLYVGFTRARNRVILYGNLAEKYGGLVHA